MSLAMQLLLLDVWGLLSSLAIALAIYFFGGALAGEYLAVMFAFLISATIVTMMGREKKEDLGIYEYGRSWQNVLANGVVPVLSLALGAPYAYFGAISATIADKFSSEIGALGATPIFLGDLKPAKKGTSGAITAMGLVAGVFGSIIVSATVYLLFPGVGLGFALLLPVVGLAGTLADSVAGVFETRGIGDKATSNLAGALTGAVFGQLIAFALGLV
ncbi:Uncharacterised protein [uncultured archaeon]|nr:Uncharacterised protein [uncultured archaeon]